MLRDLQRMERQQNSALDSIADARSQEERMLNEANDRFSDVIGLMEVILAVAGILALYVGWRAKQSIDTFDEKLRKITEAEAELSKKVASAEEAVAKIEKYTKDARVELDKLSLVIPDSPDFSFGEPLAKDIKAKLREYIRRIEVLDAFGLPLEAEDFFKLGNAYAALDQYNESISAYDRSLSLKPEVPEALNNRGASLAMLQRFEEAITAVNEALKHKPDHYTAYAIKGTCYYMLEKHLDSIAAFDAALKIKPGYYEAHFSKGNCFAALNRHEEAVSAFDKAIEHKPDYHQAHYNKGRSLFALVRHAEAIAAYDAGLKIKPNDLSAMYNKACIYSFMHKKHEMLEWLAKAIAGDEKYKQMSQTDPDFEFYRNDPDFRKLVGLPPLEEGGKPE